MPYDGNYRDWVTTLEGNYQELISDYPLIMCYTYCILVLSKAQQVQESEENEQ